MAQTTEISLSNDDDVSNLSNSDNSTDVGWVFMSLAEDPITWVLILVLIACCCCCCIGATSFKFYYMRQKNENIRKNLGLTSIDPLQKPQLIHKSSTSRSKSSQNSMQTANTVNSANTNNTNNNGLSPRIPSIQLPTPGNTFKSHLSGGTSRNFEGSISSNNINNNIHPITNINNINNINNQLPPIYIATTGQNGAVQLVQTSLHELQTMQTIQSMQSMQHIHSINNVNLGNIGYSPMTGMPTPIGVGINNSIHNNINNNNNNINTFQGPYPFAPYSVAHVGPVAPVGNTSMRYITTGSKPSRRTTTVSRDDMYKKTRDSKSRSAKSSKSGKSDKHRNNHKHDTDRKRMSSKSSKTSSKNGKSSKPSKNNKNSKSSKSTSGTGTGNTTDSGKIGLSSKSNVVSKSQTVPLAPNAFHFKKNKTETDSNFASFFDHFLTKSGVGNGVAAGHNRNQSDTLDDGEAGDIEDGDEIKSIEMDDGENRFFDLSGININTANATMHTTLRSDVNNLNNINNINNINDINNNNMNNINNINAINSIQNISHPNILSNINVNNVHTVNNMKNMIDILNSPNEDAMGTPYPKPGKGDNFKHVAIKIEDDGEFGSLDEMTSNQSMDNIDVHVIGNNNSNNPTTLNNQTSIDPSQLAPLNKLLGQNIHHLSRPRIANSWSSRESGLTDVTFGALKARQTSNSRNLNPVNSINTYTINNHNNNNNGSIVNNMSNGINNGNNNNNNNSGIGGTTVHSGYNTMSNLHNLMNSNEYDGNDSGIHIDQNYNETIHGNDESDCYDDNATSTYSTLKNLPSVPNINSTIHNKYSNNLYNNLYNTQSRIDAAAPITDTDNDATDENYNNNNSNYNNNFHNKSTELTASVSDINTVTHTRESHTTYDTTGTSSHPTHPRHDTLTSSEVDIRIPSPRRKKGKNFDLVRQNESNLGVLMEERSDTKSKSNSGNVDTKEISKDIKYEYSTDNSYLTKYNPKDLKSMSIPNSMATFVKHKHIMSDTIKSTSVSSNSNNRRKRQNISVTGARAETGGKSNNTNQGNISNVISMDSTEKFQINQAKLLTEANMEYKVRVEYDLWGSAEITVPPSSVTMSNEVNELDRMGSGTENSLISGGMTTDVEDLKDNKNINDKYGIEIDKNGMNNMNDNIFEMKPQLMETVSTNVDLGRVASKEKVGVRSEDARERSQTTQTGQIGQTSGINQFELKGQKRKNRFVNMININNADNNNLSSSVVYID